MKPPPGSDASAAASVTCEGETSCVRVPAVPNVASRAPAGVRRARPTRCVVGPVALLTVETTSAVPSASTRRRRRVDLVDGRGGAVEVGDRVAGGRAVGRVEHAGGGQAGDDQLVARRGRPAAGEVDAARAVEREVGEGRGGAAEAEARPRRRSRSVGVADAGGGQAHEQAAVGAAAGGGGGDEDVAVGGDGEVAQLRLGAGRRDQLAAGRERRVEMTVGGQAGDEQRRREVDGQRGPAEQDLAVGRGRSARRA